VRYAQERESFGVPIWKHQSIGNYLADMATKVTAARQLILHAAERFDSGQRCNLEAGMAKLFAFEVAMQVALDAVRIHGGYVYSTEFDVERNFRDAPLMIVGEGTNEIQRNVIAAQLVKRIGLTDGERERSHLTHEGRLRRFVAELSRQLPAPTSGPRHREFSAASPSVVSPRTGKQSRGGRIFDGRLGRRRETRPMSWRYRASRSERSDNSR
jgi:Acyl-CoA dehydrogenase, C-terminal domain